MRQITKEEIEFVHNKDLKGILNALIFHQNIPAFKFQIEDRLNAEEDIQNGINALEVNGYLEVIPTYKLTDKGIELAKGFKSV